MNEERRKFIRISTDKIRIKIRKFTGRIDSQYYNVSNFSIGGVLVVYEEPLAPGDYVMLTIDALEKGFPHLVKCVATVNRVVEQDGRYDTALEFVKINNDDLNYLRSITGEDNA